MNLSAITGAERADPKEHAFYRRRTTARDVRERLTYPGEWFRYSSFTVNAHLQGQTISYRATFLFADQGRKIAIFDPAMRMPVELNGPFYPALLVESVYRDYRISKNGWRRINSRLASGLKSRKYAAIRRQAAGGLASEDVAHSLTLPLDDNDRWVLKGLMEPEPVAKKSADLRVR